jgi:hypothetical protein
MQSEIAQNDYLVPIHHFLVAFKPRLEGSPCLRSNRRIWTRRANSRRILSCVQPRPLVRR